MRRQGWPQDDEADLSHTGLPIYVQVESFRVGKDRLVCGKFGYWGVLVTPLGAGRFWVRTDHKSYDPTKTLCGSNIKMRM